MNVNSQTQFERADQARQSDPNNGRTSYTVPAAQLAEAADVSHMAAWRRGDSPFNSEMARRMAMRPTKFSSGSMFDEDTLMRPQSAHPNTIQSTTF